MKNSKYFLLAALAAGTVQVASAVNYSPNDLILVFRGTGFNDVEFDLGPVSNYIGLTAGTQVPVSYDKTLVSNNFLGSIIGANFSLVAATATSDGTSPSARVWTTDSSVYSSANNVTYSKLSSLRSRIQSIGVQATAATSSNATAYVVSPSSASSYSYIASGGTGSSISTFQGLSVFPVDAANPTTLAFYELKAATGTGATLVGAFTIDVDGSLYFTAGQLPALTRSTATGLTSVAGLNTVSFTTVKGNNYQLQYAPALPGPWIDVTGATAIGDGTVQSLQDTSSDPSRYYRVVSIY
ncbi:MAG: hypothetical protein U1F98_09010 [Verrucomicrobiota bacterium]